MSYQTTLTGATGMGALHGVNIAPLGQDVLRIGNQMDINSQISIGLTKAVGGFIVQVRTADYARPDYYVVPDNAEDFDRELGKIISLHLLKSNT
jgi:hypothetical protein